MSAEDTNKVAEKNSELLKKKQSAFKSKQAESALYTQDEDKGGWGSKNTFLRRHLDSPNTTKCAFANQSPRFQKSEPLVDKMYDVDTGSGARRTIGLAVAESPRRYGAVFNETKRFSDDKEGCGTSALYNVGENPNTGTLEYRLDKHPRRYTNMKSVVPRGFDPKDIGRNVPDYDFGDGPKHNFAHQLKNTPRKYCMMGSTEARDAPLCRDGTDKPIDPVEPYDTDVVKNISIARSIELTGIEYANMRSKVERFRPPDPE